MLIDIETRPTEGEHTIADLVERATRHGVSTPVLHAARCSLQAYKINRSSS
jgi:2-dehydropantoate 2-reductase